MVSTDMGLLALVQTRLAFNSHEVLMRLQPLDIRTVLKRGGDSFIRQPLQDAES
jgi:hypothetical protein